MMNHVPPLTTRIAIASSCYSARSSLATMSSTTSWKCSCTSFMARLGGSRPRGRPVRGCSVSSTRCRQDAWIHGAGREDDIAFSWDVHGVWVKVDGEEMMKKRRESERVRVRVGVRRGVGVRYRPGTPSFLHSTTVGALGGKICQHPNPRRGSLFLAPSLSCP